MDKEPFQLPSHRHVPGVNQRHDEGFADHVIGTLPDVILDTRDNAVMAVWQYALQLMAKRYYWEAHEVLEAVWMRTLPNSREYHLARAVIQVTNAGLKARMNRPAAVAKLRAQAAESLALCFRGEEKPPVFGMKPDEMNALIELHVT